MQVSVETTSKLERRLTVGVPAEQVDAEVDARLQKAIKSVRLPGFRPGKVPMRIMRQRFGAGVRQEVVGEVLSRSFQDAVVQENLKPAGQPAIEARSLEPGRDLEYVATFEIFPEIEIADVAGITVDKPQAEVTDEDVDRIIDVFRKQRGEWGAVERGAQTGDRVRLDYTGTRDGESFDGGSAENSELELGSGRMIPGFEDGIVGMAAGDGKTLSLNFPDDYHAEELRGAAVEFAVTIHAVEALEPAELGPELFAAYGVQTGDVNEFREEVRGNMARELRNAIRARVKQQVMDGVIAAHESLEVPAALIAQEIDNLRQQMFQQFGGAGKDMDLRSILPDDMFRERAERRVRLGLLLGEMLRQRELKADPDAVRAELEDLASTYEEPEEVVDWYYANPEQLSAVESKVLEDTLVDQLLAEAEVRETAVSYQEAITLGQQASSS